MNAASTGRTYARHWKTFVAWCTGVRHQPLPAADATIALFASYLASKGLSLATVEQALAAIVFAHVAAGLSTPRGPTLGAVMKGLRAKAPPPRQASPLLAEHISDFEVSSLQGLRDRALLAIGFAGGLRRSELVAIETGDLALMNDGFRISVRRSARVVLVGYAAEKAECPVRALRSWMETAGIADGPVFRRVDRYDNVGPRALTDKSVSDIVKRFTTARGLDPKAFSGHSLRCGFVSDARAHGATDSAIMAQTGLRGRLSVSHDDRRGAA